MLVWRMTSAPLKTTGPIWQGTHMFGDVRSWCNVGIVTLHPEIITLHRAVSE